MIVKRLIQTSARALEEAPNRKKKHIGSGGAMTERLKQLQEDAYLRNPNSKLIDQPDSIGEYQDKVIGNLRKKLEEIERESPITSADHQRAVSVANMPTYADNSSRQNAMNKAWTGEESPEDLARRLALERAEKPKKLIKVQLSRPQEKQARLHNAREGALDYRLSKHGKKTPEEEEREKWRAEYKERLLGPTCFGGSDDFTGVDNSIKSLADQKIQEAQRRGDFKNLKRGKPMDKDFTNRSAFLDRTEYHLNRIMKQQDAIPPWIEKQGSLGAELEHFRRELDKTWSLRAVRLIEEQNPAMNTKQLLAMLETTPAESRQVLRSDQWAQEQVRFLSPKIRQLNDSIRGYNLQAPLASQRHYLKLDREIDECYKRVHEILPEEYRRNRVAAEPQSPGSSQQSTRDAFQMFGAKKIPQRDHIPQMPTEPLSTMFWKMFTGGGDTKKGKSQR